jgi:hypothetical protein
LFGKKIYTALAKIDMLCENWVVAWCWEGLSSVLRPCGS